MEKIIAEKYSDVCQTLNDLRKKYSGEALHSEVDYHYFLGQKSVLEYLMKMGS